MIADDGHGDPLVAAERDALGADDARHHHRRGLADRDRRDRQGVASRRSARCWTNMGANTPPGPGRRGLEQRRQPRHAAASRRSLPRTPRRSVTNAPPSTAWRPIVYARRQVVYGNKNWVPIYIYGTTPSLLRVRDWETLAEGEPFTEQDVDDVAMVCLLGQTLVHELFGDESPLGKEVRVNDVPLKVLGVLSPQGDQHHRRRPGRHPAGPLDDDQVPRQRHVVAPHDAGGRGEGRRASPVRSARRIGATRGSHASLYPTPVGGPDGRHAPPRSVRERRLGPRPRPVDGGDPGGDGPDHRTACASGTRSPRVEPDDFDVKDFTEVIKAVDSDVRPGGRSPGRRGLDLAPGRRRGDHEHHARVGDRADQGDRPADGGRGRAPRHPPAVPGRGGRPERTGRRPGRGRRPHRERPGPRPRRLARRSPRCRPSSVRSPPRSPSASSSATTPPGRPRGSTRSRHCATSDRPRDPAHLRPLPACTARERPPCSILSPIRFRRICADGPGTPGCAVGDDLRRFGVGFHRPEQRSARLAQDDQAERRNEDRPVDLYVIGGGVLPLLLIPVAPEEQLGPDVLGVPVLVKLVRVAVGRRVD